MLEVIPFEEENIIGLRLSGAIDDEGFDRMIERIRAVVKKHDKVRVYAEVEGFGWESIDVFFKNMQVKFELFKEMDKFEKEALVSDKSWIEAAAKIGDAMLPSMEIKYFPVAEKELALEWIRN